jgi:hypothetical protein
VPVEAKPTLSAGGEPLNLDDLSRGEAFGHKDRRAGGRIFVGTNGVEHHRMGVP